MAINSESASSSRVICDVSSDLLPEVCMSKCSHLLCLGAWAHSDIYKDTNSGPSPPCRTSTVSHTDSSWPLRLEPLVSVYLGTYLRGTLTNQVTQLWLIAGKLPARLLLRLSTSQPILSTMEHLSYWNIPSHPHTPTSRTSTPQLSDQTRTRRSMRRCTTPSFPPELTGCRTSSYRTRSPTSIPRRKPMRCASRSVVGGGTSSWTPPRSSGETCSRRCGVWQPSRLSALGCLRGTFRRTEEVVSRWNSMGFRVLLWRRCPERTKELESDHCASSSRMDRFHLSMISLVWAYPAYRSSPWRLLLMWMKTKTLWRTTSPILR